MDQTIIGSNRRIDPTRRAHLKPDLTPDDNDRVEIGPTGLAFGEWAAAGLTPPDMPAHQRDHLVNEMTGRIGGPVASLEIEETGTMTHLANQRQMR